MYRINSKDIQPGDSFICLPCAEKYCDEARAKGAASVLNMNRLELAELANQRYNFPSHKLRVIGITGTNGKTTTTYLIAQGLEKAGFKPCILGTINARLTTPESIEIQQAMAEHLAHGGTHFVMEVSSHGIDQGRVAGIQFFIKILTNITQDHLDYHKTFENYKETKHRFMNEADESIKIWPEDFKKVNLDFNIPLIGRFNYENMQAAYLALQHSGVPPATIQAALSEAKAPDGRFEKVDMGQPFLVVVDYAHTPDGLENILEEARHIAETRKGQVLTVFGCGGDRDRGKRPKMAHIVSQLSDHYIVTQDNPRTEDPTQIIKDILQGVHADKKPHAVIDDRRTAIETIIDLANPNDIVIIAGKGHEDYQILKTGKIHFDDREEARTAIKKRMGASSSQSRVK